MTLWCNNCGKELNDEAFRSTPGMLEISRADDEHDWDTIGTFCSDDCMFKWIELIIKKKALEEKQ